MITLALSGRARHIYHVGTGDSHRVGDGLDFLIRLSGKTVRARVDPSLRNRRGPADSRADISRIVDHTQWQPKIPWEQSLIDLWNEVANQPASFHDAA
jgi:nucleoside-diphosphate-sugar epimerase